jgi:hypothetical protein
MTRSLGWTFAKWIGLLLEAYLLFVLVNTALLLPEPYDWRRIAFVVAAAALAAANAYGNGIVQLKLAGEKTHAWNEPLVAFPFVAWGLVTISVAAVLIIHYLSR